MAASFAIEKLGQYSYLAFQSSRIAILDNSARNLDYFLPSLQENEGNVHLSMSTSLPFVFFQVHFSKSPYNSTA
jgi:hypothetical protein